MKNINKIIKNSLPQMSENFRIMREIERKMTAAGIKPKPWPQILLLAESAIKRRKQ